MTITLPANTPPGEIKGNLQLKRILYGKEIEVWRADALPAELTIQDVTPPRLVVVGEVIGNTASYNSVAEFTVRLSHQPTADVIIPVSSSDINEGIPAVSSLTFTPDNWFVNQTVIVTGTNSNVQNGVQDYLVSLLPAQSSDSSYEGIDADDIAMKGIALELSVPVDLNLLISELPASFTPRITYTGNKQVSFSLLEAPEGMQIDFNTGAISWTPPVSAEGKSFNVTAKVTDGALFDEVSFPVTVTQTTLLQTSNNGTTVTVTEANSNLLGLSITDTSAVATNLSGLEINRVTTGSVPAIPNWITPITDAFVIKSKVETSVAIRMPLSQLPQGSGVEDVNLHGYVKALDVPMPIWSKILIDIDYEGDADNPVVVIHLNGVHGLLFFGVSKSQAAPALESSAVSLIQKNLAMSLSDSDIASIAADVTCAPRSIYRVPNYNRQDCTWAGDPDFKVFVKDFGLFSGSKNWGITPFDGATIQDLIAWLVVARNEFKTLNLDSDSKLTVDIETFVNPSTGGYVTTENNENFGTLHLNRLFSSLENMQATVAHEYFHHAQARSGVIGKSLLVNGDHDGVVWMIEGSARWFEDFLYDSLNTYTGLKPGPRIMEHGLDGDNKEVNYAEYQRFSFFKLLSEKCSSFKDIYRELVNHNKSTDPTGINNLVTELGAASCDFGSHFGADKLADMDTALVYYQYATLFVDNPVKDKGKISLLDSNEDDSKFSFNPTPYLFDKPWLDTTDKWLNRNDTSDFKLNGVNTIPPIGAYSFHIKGIQGQLPAGKVAVLTVESDVEVIVSLTSKDTNFQGDNQIGTNQHIWFSTKEKSNFEYPFNGTIPEVFVSLVNPSASNTATLKVTFNIINKATQQITITSPSEGGTVRNRVISLTGAIQTNGDATANIDRIVATKNNIKTIATVTNSNFSVDAIATLGANIIKLQGFNSNDMTKPLTAEKILNLTGVENTSSTTNALIPSRITYVLRWNTSPSDIDIYTSDPNNETVWYADRSKTYGFLDFDNTSGFGPEVVTYRNSSNIPNGNYLLDVHYYSGTLDTDYSIDVVLNETEPGNLRVRHYDSIVPLTEGDSSLASPTGAETAGKRYNDIISVKCAGTCDVDGFSNSKLTEGTRPVALPTIMRLNLSPVLLDTKIQPQTVYEQCMAAKEVTDTKGSYAEWNCDFETGAKIWP